MNTRFPVLSKDDAPEAAKASLDTAHAKYGFDINLFGVMAASPPLLKGYLSLAGMLDETSLSDVEKQVVLLSTSYENECHYCMAAHSTVAQMVNAPADVVAALREGTPIPDMKLEALRRFTAKVVQSRGFVSEQDIEDFLAAGYGNEQILEVILGVGLKTLSNYTNHFADTPVDQAFQPQAWSKAS